jgi:hypothetical protein
MQKNQEGEVQSIRRSAIGRRMQSEQSTRRSAINQKKCNIREKCNAIRRSAINQKCNREKCNAIRRIKKNQPNRTIPKREATKPISSQPYINHVVGYHSIHQ